MISVVSLSGCEMPLRRSMKLIVSINLCFSASFAGSLTWQAVLKFCGQLYTTTIITLAIYDDSRRLISSQRSTTKKNDNDDKQ